MSDQIVLRSREEILQKIEELDQIILLNLVPHSPSAEKRRKDLQAKKQALFWVLGEKTNSGKDINLSSTL